MSQEQRQGPARPARDREPSRSKSTTSGRTWIRAFWRSLRGSRGVKKEVGQYRILCPLAQGGMTDVLLGETVDQGRPIVVKFLQEGAKENVGERVRFQRAARIGAVMDHVHIASILYGGDWDGELCIVEEFVDGVDLSKWLKQHHTVPLEVALLILRDLSSAVMHVHERGVVHRDLKPANVMFSTDGAVKLMDFGIARRLEESLDVTEMGVAPATIAYAAPEQLEMNRAGDLGRHTDVWALGVICYELFTGSRPFTGEARDVKRQILTCDPQPLSVLRPELPTELSRRVMQMLARNVDDRCASAEEVLDALERGIDELGIRNQGRLLRAYARDPEAVQRELESTRRQRVEDVARSTTQPTSRQEVTATVSPTDDPVTAPPALSLPGTVKLTDPLASVRERTLVTRAATPREMAGLEIEPPAAPVALHGGASRQESSSDVIEIPGPPRWPWFLATAAVVAIVGFAIPQVRTTVSGLWRHDRSQAAATSPLASDSAVSAVPVAPRADSGAPPSRGTGDSSSASSPSSASSAHPPAAGLLARARLQIVPEPPDAEVMVDQTWSSVGTFDRSGLAARRHSVRVQHSGFEPRTIQVELQGGRDTIVTVKQAPVTTPAADGHTGAARGGNGTRASTLRVVRTE